MCKKGREEEDEKREKRRPQYLRQERRWPKPDA
jgi:hypothetical protein